MIRYLKVCLLFVFVFTIFTHNVYADNTSFQKISLAPIATSILSQEEVPFPYGDNVILGTDQIPFLIPEYINDSPVNYYNSASGNAKYKTLDISINSPIDAYFIISGGGTYNEESRPTPLKFGEINLYFSDNSALKTELIERFNLREWILDAPYSAHTTSDPNVQEVWRGMSPGGNGPVVADMLKIPISGSFAGKTLSKIEIIDITTNKGFHILGITIKTGEGAPTPPPTHKACQNNACLVVNGVGSDSCTQNSDCVPPTHLACQNYSCVLIDGIGTNSCNNNMDCAPPPPLPVVFIPGFGGSWSYKGLIEHQPTTYADWQLTPFFTEGIYQPLLTTLKNSGVNPMIFAFDYRKSIVDSAPSLNQFLADTIPGKKANIITHSMGSLVVRQCYEKVAGCADKINKIVTAGGPNQGTLAAYKPWETGDFEQSNIYVKTALELALHSGSYVYKTDKDIVQHDFLGVRDLLPIYLPSPNNLNLKALFPYSANYLANATALSGNSAKTAESFTTIPRNATEKVLGLWTDGKPGVYLYDVGDGTVLKSSSQIAGGLNKDYDLWHGDYFTNRQPLIDILTIFDLPANNILTTANKPSSILSFILHSPATISINGHMNTDDKSIFITNSEPQIYKIDLTGKENGNYLLEALFTSNNLTIRRYYYGKITQGELQTLYYNFFPNATQKFLGKFKPSYAECVSDLAKNKPEADKSYWKNICNQIKEYLTK